SAKRYDISTVDDVGVKAIRSYVAVAKQHGGYENIGCLEKDFRNQLDKECRLALESGDANAMLEFFVHMQEENPNFFYALDLDEEHHLKNIFWVDAKGREDYREFGDVVSLDTTYITNKYKMPFTPFIGVNNHHQATLLGCALLANESTSTFTWLMKTWVRAMGGKLPSAIITDQNKAMKAAIKLVFPNSRHHYCLWHILRKFPEKLGYVLRKNEDFMGIFKKCIHKSWTKDQFEERWQAMVEKFDLIEDEWIQSLYEDREHWVPTYMKDTFFAGMSTTQRSESINSFLDKYVCRKTTLKEFLEKYEVALQDRQEAENLADFTAWHKTPALRTPSPFEKQMSMVYTHGVFKKFQIEVLGIFGCHLVKEKEDEKILTFKVLEIEKNEGFIVEWDASMEEISCICRSFEYNGFLCRHSLSTLHFLGLFNIPSRYIVKSWTKDVRTKYKKGSTCEEVQSKKQRRDILFQRAIELIEGSMSHESYNIAHQALGDALKHCSSVNHSLKLSDEAAFGANEYHDL
ncbi:protein FAR-RED IMPAIRED RESPONSE 1-like, partial [Durio zibethinus]|uniref:Protein FAR1-RELATED SEQUENCE n=1 Tax=Durio zibethinus TaxID=66656 RepID=A0A6P6AHP8_DURZI